VPQTVLDLPFVRTVGVVTINQWDNLNGLALSTVTVTNNNDGGFYTAPIQIPQECDVTRPISIFNVIRNPQLASAVPGVINFEPRISYLDPAGNLLRLDISHAYAVPANWPAGAFDNLLFDSDLVPNGFTIPGHTIPRDSWLGVRVYRNGSAVGDTYANAIQFLASCQLWYYRRCQRNCC
jgi:hypothetical protein